MLAIGESAVCVGTDDAGLAARLAPWALPGGSPATADDGGSDDHRLVDYAVELHPPQPTHRAAPRTLPNLRHGTTVIGRGSDGDELCTGLLRILGSFAGPVPDGFVRITGLPLLSESGVELVQPDVADHLGRRWLQARGLAPVPVATVVIDPTTLLVHIDAPLGATEPPLTLPLRRWWCALPDPGAELTFARLVAHLGHRLAPPVTAADDERISEALAALVRIAERLPPERIGFEAEDLRHRLARSAPARPSRSAGPA